MHETKRDMTDREFKDFQTYIYSATGIHYPPEKVTLLSNRIRKRLRDRNLPDYGAYLAILKGKRDRQEQQEFINVVTTNETYFFRCQRHWDFLKEWFIAKKKSGAKGDIRLWSAAASNGSEAYSMLITAAEALGPNMGGFRVSVHGTDLNDSVLAEARAATYGRYAVAQMDAKLLDRYFETDGKNYKFTPKLAKLAKFEPHNLQTSLRSRPFDIVMVRNVMIYFDQPSKENVLKHVFNSTVPGGYVMVGESESLVNLQHDFKLVKPTIFHRPPAGNPVAK